MYPRCFGDDNVTIDPANQCTKTEASDFAAMGVSIRTAEWRCAQTVWTDGGRASPAC